MKVASSGTGDATGRTPAPVRAGTVAVSARPSRLGAFESRNFRLLWIGLLIANAGTWMQTTAEGWLVTDLEPGQKAFWLGMIAAAFAVPMLILPPLGGAIADRVPRMTLLWIVQIAYLVTSVVLAAITVAGLITVWYLIGYSFLMGATLAFDSPLRHALLPDLVSRERLTSAVSLNSVAFTGAALIGPAIAGGVIPLIGVRGVFVIRAISCLATIWALMKMTGVPQRSHRRSAETAFEAIATGVRYVWREPMMRTLLTVSLISGLASRSYTPMLAVFARDEFHVGSEAYGLLLAAGGLGTLAGAFGLASRGDVRGRGRWLFASSLVQAALLLLFAICPWYVVGLGLLVCVGIANAVSGALNATLIQLAVPGELRGRIMSLYVLTLVGVPSAGAMAAGTIGEATGVREAIGGGAAIVIVLVTIVFVRNPALRAAE